MARRPYISNSSYYKLTIPELSGGVNLRDNISLIHDNQLTDCENVWYKDGMLRTRAGMKATDYNEIGESFVIDPNSYTKSVCANNKNTRIEDGNLYFLVVERSPFGVEVKYVCSTNPEKPVIDVATIKDLPSSRINVFQNGGDIYLFGSLERGVSLANGLPIYKIWYEETFDELGEVIGGEWKTKRIQMSDAYVPTVMINVPPGIYDNIGGAYGATMLEGYNLLGNRYKMYFNNAIEYQSPSEEKIYHDVGCFTLLEDVSNFAGETVKLTIAYVDGKVATHEVTIVGGDHTSYEGELNEIDGFEMYVIGKKIYFRDVQFSDMMFARTQFMQNCIEVEAPCSNTEENLKKVLNMTFNTWFGGGSEGLYGGVHLFLGGNTEEKHKSLVLWSDINKPLYFSENCYAYVGDKTQSVTAFGKQGEALIIAKDREMYATQYVNNSDAVNEEAVQKQAVVDITTDVIFPMTQVHGLIGCDCPNTMQLCRNRLVWANSNGKVYSLVSANQYNERSIYEVSGMVERRLKEFAPKELQGAFSADWKGFYVLMVGNNLFLMDYNSYGFSNVYSYSKTEDAQSRIPWWIWKLDLPNDVEVLSLTNSEEKLFFTHTLNIKLKYSNRIELLYFDGDGVQDEVANIKSVPNDEGKLILVREKENKEIPTMVKTKYYDFNSSTTLKNIPKIELSLGTNGGTAINVTAITDKGESDTVIYVDAPEEDRYSVGHFDNKVIRPLANRANRLALKFTCDGDMAIDGMTIIYKMLGGIK